MADNITRITIEVDPQIKRRLKACAADEGESMKSFLVRLIQEYIKKKRD